MSTQKGNYLDIKNKQNIEIYFDFFLKVKKKLKWGFINVLEKFLKSSWNLLEKFIIFVIKYYVISHKKNNDNITKKNNDN